MPKSAEIRWMLENLISSSYEPGKSSRGNVESLLSHQSDEMVELLARMAVSYAMDTTGGSVLVYSPQLRQLAALLAM